MLHATQTEPQPTGADAIAAAASAIAGTVKLGAIVCYTATGSTVLRVTRERPGMPVIGLTPIESTARRLSLVWGVQTILTGDPENSSHMVRKACRIAFEEGLVKARDGIGRYRRHSARQPRRDEHGPHRVHRRARRADRGRGLASADRVAVADLRHQVVCDGRRPRHNDL